MREPFRLRALASRPRQHVSPTTRRLEYVCMTIGEGRGFHPSSPRAPSSMHDVRQIAENVRSQSKVATVLVKNTVNTPLNPIPNRARCQRHPVLIPLCTQLTSPPKTQRKGRIQLMRSCESLGIQVRTRSNGAVGFFASSTHPCPATSHPLTKPLPPPNDIQRNLWARAVLCPSSIAMRPSTGRRPAEQTTPFLRPMTLRERLAVDRSSSCISVVHCSFRIRCVGVAC